MYLGVNSAGFLRVYSPTIKDHQRQHGGGLKT